MNRDMRLMTNIMTIMFVIVTILLSAVVLQLLTQEHYKVARYTVERVEGSHIYYDGGSIYINQFYFPIQNDMNLSKGDDIKIHYLESFLGRKTYIEIEKVEQR